MSDSDSARFDLRTPEQRHQEEIKALQEQVKVLASEVNRQRDEIEYVRILLDRMLVTPK